MVPRLFYLPQAKPFWDYKDYWRVGRRQSVIDGSIDRWFGMIYIWWSRGVLPRRLICVLTKIAGALRFSSQEHCCPSSATSAARVTHAEYSFPFPRRSGSDFDSAGALTTFTLIGSGASRNLNSRLFHFFQQHYRRVADRIFNQTDKNRH